MVEKEPDWEFGIRTEGHQDIGIGSEAVILGENGFEYAISGSNWGHLPEGWVYESIFGKKFAKKKSLPYSKSKAIMASNDVVKNKVIPKTATNMPTYILLGLISVLLSLSFFVVSRKYEINKSN